MASRRGLLLASSVLVGALAACAPTVSVTQTTAARSHQARLESVLNGSGLSEGTLQILRRYDMDADWEAGRERDVIARVRAIDAADARRTASVPLAELLIARGEHLVSQGRADASLFLDAARAALRKAEYDLSGEGALLDARTAFAVQIYNRAVSRIVTLTQEDWPESPGHLDVAGESGWFRLYIDADSDNAALWDPDYFDEYVSANEIIVDGMRNHHRRTAFGAPLVAIRENTPERDAVEPFHPPEGMIYPATAVIAFADTHAGTIDARVRIYNTESSRVTELGGRRVLLSEDLTAPHATLFARTNLGEEGLKGLSNVERYLERVGVYSHSPYDPQKIPVLFVHGLRSSPITWRDVLNDLYADPVLRERYQFWTFLYPTGLPIPRAAAYLRSELREIRDELDPEGDDPGPRNILVVGHSMGGLLSKTLTHDAGNELWGTYFAKDPERFPAELGDERAFFDEIFLYERDPDVARVVFVATPHRGSVIATNIIGIIGRWTVELPRELGELADRINDADPDYIRERFRDMEDAVPTSIHNLDPESPVLAAYNRLGVGVPHHTIIGDRGKPDADPRSDGVVTYASSSLETAESEIVVPEGHNAHGHPLAIEELRRILHLHLREVNRAAAAAR